MLQQFMKRWNLSKTERLGSCPKVSHISTTSNYSGSQSLSSIREIQFSVFILNFLKQNQKRNSKIELHGSCPKVSHTSTTSNYSGSQSLRGIWEIQFWSRIRWKNTLLQFMKRWNLPEIERLWSCPKVSHISTTSNYSGSQSLSSIREIQFSVFILNFLKQNQKRNSKIELHGSCPKVSHTSTTSNYSGSQSLRGIWEIQFWSRIRWKNTLLQFMKRWNLPEIERLWSCPKVSHISTTSNYSGSQSLSSIWDIQF